MVRIVLVLLVGAVSGAIVSFIILLIARRKLKKTKRELGEVLVRLCSLIGKLEGRVDELKKESVRRKVLGEEKK